jgi:ribosomal protein S18 acetylase RimI-like enzyme
MPTIRPAELPRDRAAIAAIDLGFETAVVLTLEADKRGLQLVEVRLDAPITKTFPLDDIDDPQRPWTFAVVAEIDGRVIGFAASEYRQWNRRMVIWHLYVDRAHRGAGLARRLLDAIEDQARADGALRLWLETSNLNVPGLAAYERLGFRLSGIDASLYDGTPAEGEFAIFLERPVPGFARSDERIR